MLVAVAPGDAVPQDDDRGVLAGIRYLARDRLLGPLTLTVIVLDGAADAIAVAVPLVAYTRYGENAHVAGWLFTGFGVGAVIGSVLASSCSTAPAAAPRVRRCCCDAAAVGDRVADLVAGGCGGGRDLRLFVPMVNAPMMGLLTTRPPAPAREGDDAVMTASGLGGPGRLAVGPV